MSRLTAEDSAAMLHPLPGQPSATRSPKQPLFFGHPGRKLFEFVKPIEFQVYRWQDLLISPQSEGRLYPISR